ncbi:MAG: fibronectin type III domain-containing protein, partial [Bacteroidota bacterium]
MNKLFKRILYIVSIFAAFGIAGCTDDIPDEITELELSRLLSPTELDVRVINQTSARLTWKAVNNASSYVVEFHDNGDLNFEGTPLTTVEGVLFNQLPLIVPGFEGQTTYSARVKAVGEEIADSKWISGIFITDAEQIFFPVNPEEITADGVILRWPAGEFATHILLEPGNINIPLSEDEVAAGVVEITGLESETEYTAYLMNEDKIRGTVTFITLIDTGNAIIVEPGEDLKAIVEGAVEGDVFALMPGDYIFPGNIYVNTTVEIVAADPLDKPVLYGVNFRMV